MTFRQLLKGARYKDVFNIIWREYYKGATIEEGYVADVACLRLFDQLQKLPPNINPPFVIWVHEHSCQGVDICLRKDGEECCTSFSSLPLEDLIDAEVHKGELWSNVRVLAHLLYKLS